MFSKVHAVARQVSQIVVGKDLQIRQSLVCLLAGGHLLIEDVPGVGKTTLAHALAVSLGLKFNRLQFTSDLLPADVVGISIFDREKNGFAFHPGPIFTQLLLADEINRATPKTQSALLETMQENSVTIGKITHALEQPVCVLATQNPIELEGTYPLPEAQLDRFFYKLRMEFPSAAALDEILERTTQLGEPEVQRVLGQGEILDMRDIARSIPVAKSVKDYAIRLMLATHPENVPCHEMVKRYVRYGSSPRGAQALLLGGKVHALMQNRVYVAGEDIRAAAFPALRHRMLLNYEGQAEGIDVDTIISAIIESLPEPRK
jgi:MoxR-like ATPase